MGKGCWFASATDPTVPLARLTTVPTHTLGSFYVGNTNYVPLQQKQLRSQIVAVYALMGDEHVNKKKYVPVEYKNEKLNKADYIVKGSLKSSYIDTDLYVKWLRKTKAPKGALIFNQVVRYLFLQNLFFHIVLPFPYCYPHYRVTPGPSLASLMFFLCFFPFSLPFSHFLCYTFFVRPQL